VLEHGTAVQLTFFADVSLLPASNIVPLSPPVTSQVRDPQAQKFNQVMDMWSRLEALSAFACAVLSWALFSGKEGDWHPRMICFFCIGSCPAELAQQHSRTESMAITYTCGCGGCGCIHMFS
jgi:hypothetical protein